MGKTQTKRTKPKKYVKLFFIFNAALMILFWLIIKAGWISSPYSETSLQGVIFWSGAFKNLILLSGIWIFMDVLFAAWFYHRHKVSKKK